MLNQKIFRWQKYKCLSLRNEFLSSINRSNHFCFSLADAQVEFKGRTDAESENIPLAEIKAKVIAAVKNNS